MMQKLFISALLIVVVATVVVSVVSASKLHLFEKHSFSSFHDDKLPETLAPDNAEKSPTSSIDLALPPKQRWTKILTQVLQRHGFDYAFKPVLGIINPLIAKLPELDKTLDYLLEVTQKRFPVYFEELEGFVETLQALGFTQQKDGVSLKTFLAYNYLSELSQLNLTSSSSDVVENEFHTLLMRSKACTSFVTRCKTTGKLYHVRNDDANAHHYMTNSTVDTVFYNSSNPTSPIVAKATVFVGFIGTYTVQRPQIASLTQDQRILINETKKLTLPQWTQLIKENPGMGPSPFIMRQAMIDENPYFDSSSSSAKETRTFENIRRFLARSATTEPSYMILSGVKNQEASIIVRNFTAQDTRIISIGTTFSWQQFDWALLETNYEPDLPLPFPKYDNRRTVIVDHIGKVGRDNITTPLGMLQTLSIPSSNNHTNGVLNIGTIFTVIFDTTNGVARSYLRNWKGCCA